MGLLGVALVSLKVTGMTDLHWIGVLAPYWVPQLTHAVTYFTSNLLKKIYVNRIRASASKGSPQAGAEKVQDVQRPGDVRVNSGGGTETLAMPVLSPEVSETEPPRSSGGRGTKKAGRGPK